MGELFGNCLNLKGLVFLFFEIYAGCRYHMGDVIPIYLFLPWNKIFFGHLLARTLYFGMIHALVSMNRDWGPVERAADGIDNDKDAWPV